MIRLLVAKYAVWMESEGLNESATAAVVQVLDSIGKNRGGLTRAVLERFRLLSEGRRAILVTVAYQPDVRTVFEELKRDGSLPDQTELLNYYEDQRQTSRRLLPRVSMPHEDWESGAPFQGAPEASAHGTQIRYFLAGTFAGLVYRDSAGILRHVDKHDENRPWIREYRDTSWIDGSVSRREYFDEQNKARFRIYIDAEKRPYLSAWVSPEGYEYRTAEHLTAGSAQHGDTRASNAAWLSRQLKVVGPAVVYTDEPRTTFALAVAAPKVFHVTSIHTTHYQNNQNNAEGIKHWANHYVDHMNNIGRLVFFTETQRRDFIRDSKFPESRAVVVPHAAPLESAARASAVAREDSSLVTVSRLADDKRIDDAIRAFAKARKRVPSATYQIWGGGPALGGLKALIQELGLTGVVTLGGHTGEPLAKFAAASASVLTSKYEGFGLVLTESFACGTPVIAYDVIYGPRDVITEANGILVANGDIDALADAMVKILSDDAFRKSLQVGAVQTASSFTDSRWAEGWQETLRVEA